MHSAGSCWNPPVYPSSKYRRIYSKLLLFLPLISLDEELKYLQIHLFRKFIANTIGLRLSSLINNVGRKPDRLLRVLSHHHVREKPSPTPLKSGRMGSRKFHEWTAKEMKIKLRYFLFHEFRSFRSGRFRTRAELSELEFHFDFFYAKNIRTGTTTRKIDPKI